jgi:hypothetical protein
MISNNNNLDKTLLNPPARSRWSLQSILQRDWRLFRAIIVIVVLMQFQTGQYVLYPFMIFSTWIHETCHGTAAILSGGRVNWLKIYENGSGLAYCSMPSGVMKRVFFKSAGYVGTALIGGVLLLFRRTKRGPRLGIYITGAVILLTSALFVRNTFGLLILIPMGLVLLLCGWKLPSNRMRDVYALLAATCCLNAILSIHVLFSTESAYVGGEVRDSDAQAVAEILGLTCWIWALIWFIFAFIMTFIGLVFALDGPDELEEDSMPCGDIV